MKTKKEKKRRSLVGRACLSVALCLLLLPLLAIGTMAVIYGSMDYSVDEQLFCTARGENATRFYYNKAPRSWTGAESNEKNGRPLWELSFLGEKRDILSGYVAEEITEGVPCGKGDGLCPLSDMPDALKNAFVAIEDRRFYNHFGIDLGRTVGAALNYFVGFDKRFGGSTITQQLIKNISSDDEITVERKVREMCRAVHLECGHSKQEILELYLNIVPLGNGCTGVRAAARLYYGKEPCALSAAQAAALAAITNSPAKYDLYHHAESNRARRDLILFEMYAQGMLTERAYREALAEDTAPLPYPEKREATYSWYTETVLSDIIRDLREQKGLSHAAAVHLALHGGLSVYTAMDPLVQETLEACFSEESKLPGACKNGLQMAMTVCDPHTGDLLGVVGGAGKKTGDRILNYATDAFRAPGSVIKPLSVYAPALEEGIITEASVFDDVPLRFLGEGTSMTAWPQNSPTVYSGLTDMRTALAYSKNTVAVRVLRELGVERSYAYLTRRLGIRSILRGRYAQDGRKLTDLAEAPLALGQLTDGATLRDLTAAYGALADGGFYRGARSYLAVLDANGEILLLNAGEGTRAFSEQTAYLMTDLLRGVTECGTAATMRLCDQVDFVGKTGTSGEGRDRWFIGYTPYLLAGIWCGYPSGGQSVPAEKRDHLAVYDEIMTALHAQALAKSDETAVFPRPGGLVEASYCIDSGEIPCEACRLDPRGARVAVGIFQKGSEPKRLCTRHTLVEYDAEGGGLARIGCPADSLTEVGLLLPLDRSFPMQIFVSDAQYVYHPPTLSAEEAKDFCGISRTPDGKQYNRLCPAEHSEKEKCFLPPRFQLPWYFGKKQRKES